MSYYSTISCGRIFFNKEYYPAINCLTNLTAYNEITELIDFNSYKSFAKLQEVILLCSFDKKLKKQLTEILEYAELIAPDENSFNFSKLFYLFDEDGWLNLDDAHCQNYSDEALIVLLASVVDKTIEQLSHISVSCFVLQ